MAFLFNATLLDDLFNYGGIFLVSFGISYPGLRRVILHIFGAKIAAEGEQEQEEQKQMFRRTNHIKHKGQFRIILIPLFLIDRDVNISRG